jgi:putative spermidine/putrescine transport system substrate-binding protein
LIVRAALRAGSSLRRGRYSGAPGNTRISSESGVGGSAHKCRFGQRNTWHIDCIKIVVSAAEYGEEPMTIRSVSRRNVFKGLAVAGAALAAPSLVRAQARELVVIGFGGTLDDPYKRAAAIVQSRRPGTTIRIVPGLSAEAIAQVKAARGASPYDMTGMEPPAILNAIAEGVLEKYDLASVPNAKNVEPRFQLEAYGYGVPVTYTVIGLAYNREMVKEPPKSWADLWKPEFKGKVGIARPASNLGLGTISMAARLFGSGPDDLDVGLAKWKEVNPVVGRTPGLLTQMMERGEIAVAPLWHTNTAIAASRGLPIGFIKPEPGTMVLPSSSTLFINSAAKDAAFDLINEMLSPEHQTFAAKAPYYFGPTVRGVLPPPDAAPFMPATAEEIAKIQAVDWTKLAPARGRITEAFDRVFAG